MARIQLGSHVNSISGGLSGDFFQKGQNYISIKRKPNRVSRVTSVSQLRRNVVEFSSKVWKTLTMAQRSKWLNTTFCGLSGYLLYLKVNHVLRPLAASNVITNCPVFNLPELTCTFNFIYVASPLSLFLQASPAPPTNLNLNVIVHPRRLPSIKPFSTPPLYLVSFTMNPLNGNLANQILIKTGMPVTKGFYYDFRFRLKSASTGAFSQEVRNSFLAT
jgi:hypothetical protein